MYGPAEEKHLQKRNDLWTADCTKQTVLGPAHSPSPRAQPSRVAQSGCFMAMQRAVPTSTAAFIAEFQLPPHYQVIRPVGRGSFGTLVAAKDTRTGKTVAIKRVEGGGGTLGTDRHESKKLLREMRLLQHFKHENIMTLHDILTPPNSDGGMGVSFSRVSSCGGGGSSDCQGPSGSGAGGGAVASAGGAAGSADQGTNHGSTLGSTSSQPAGWKQTFYLVQDLMDTDLHRVIQSAAKGHQALTDNHIRCFVYQVVRGMYACHSAKVLHRDLKPSNLLVNKDCTLRIGDFGLARGVDDAATDANQLTEYVVTRWYRAPELLCGNENYGPPIDLWSVGCILAEMLGRQPLFPGRDVLTQLKLIVTIVKVPDPAVLATFVHNAKAIEFILQIAKQAPPPPPFAERFPNAPEGSIDLLEKLLTFDPSQRISAADALNHPFLRPLHDLNTEPTASPFDFSFENATDSELREHLDAEVRRFHPESIAPASHHADAPIASAEDSAATMTEMVEAGSLDESGAGVASAASTASGKARLAPAASRGGIGKKRQR